ncbi:MAG TPA: Gfo/Idh/MocA family oxidoreductase [Acidimicrobiia bacterium]|nr:Gfo/Idh/MocA family oxidoreductase [Acidimicrobiia bacterium]
MVEAILIGAGQRGHHVYGRWARENPLRLRFVAVADPNPERVRRFADAHGIGRHGQFTDPDELLARPPLATACIIASPDRHHFLQAIAALSSGYHVLCEKPMAASLAECIALANATRSASGTFHVAHVLRFTPFFQTLRRVLESGRLGEVVTLEHRENVWAWHMAHSYVRGNWARSGEAAPMIVAKCCHDFDILHWNLGSMVTRLSSFGSLYEFQPERAPAGATDRCTDPCPVDDCPYDARRVYLDPALTGWPVHVITDDLSPVGRLEALRHGPYGRCAYKAGSDVVDHQVVAMEYANGVTAVLHMHGHSHEEGRTMRYDGTRATLRGRFGRYQSIELNVHATGLSEEVPIEIAKGSHGGGDAGILELFTDTIEQGLQPATSAVESLESHLLAFLAEEARLSGRVIDVAERRAGL